MSRSYNLFNIGFLTTLILVILTISATAAKNPFRLKPGAAGKACLQCHIEAKDFKKQKHVHGPVGDNDCTACHAPHASDHGALLKQEVEPLCLECHDGVLPEQAMSKHAAITEQGCTGCHDPHASDYAAQLLEPAGVICLGCHDEIQALMKTTNVHSPAEDDCLTCHDPHASESGRRLLVRSEPDLCLECHQADSKNFRRQHMDYPVEQSRCTSCHNPHGSDGEGLFPQVAHSPVTRQMCNQCHDESNAKDPLALKADGFRLCQACHNRSVNAMLNSTFVHWPALGGDGCLSCHTPHASSYDGLLKEKPFNVCGSCHEKSTGSMASAAVQHEPVLEGACSECHTPHSADNPQLLRETEQTRLCGNCHDWQAHATHPIGEAVADPRNRSLSVQCSSCHNVHGTNNEHMLHTATVTDICVQCHAQYRR